jgi:hypothetical protein
MSAAIMLHISPSEQNFLESKSYHTAHQLYNLLYQRHTQLGVTVQVSLINNALAVSFSPKVHVSETLCRLKDYNSCIWAIGQPSSEAFLSILTLHCIRPIRDLRRDIENGLATIPNYGLDDITHRLQLYESENQKDIPRCLDPLISTANIATSSRNVSNSNTSRNQPCERLQTLRTRRIVLHTARGWLCRVDCRGGISQAYRRPHNDQSCREDLYGKTYHKCCQHHRGD